MQRSILKDNAILYGGYGEMIPVKAIRQSDSQITAHWPFNSECMLVQHIQPGLFMVLVEGRREACLLHERPGNNVLLIDGGEGSIGGRNRWALCFSLLCSGIPFLFSRLADGAREHNELGLSCGDCVTWSFLAGTTARVKVHLV